MTGVVYLLCLVVQCVVIRRRLCRRCRRLLYRQLRQRCNMSHVSLVDLSIILYVSAAAIFFSLTLITHSAGQGLLYKFLANLVFFFTTLIAIILSCIAIVVYYV